MIADGSLSLGKIITLLAFFSFILSVECGEPSATGICGRSLGCTVGFAHVCGQLNKFLQLLLGKSGGADILHQFQFTLHVQVLNLGDVKLLRLLTQLLGQQ